jgi:hypothetical protein
MAGYEGVTQRLPRLCARCAGEMREGVAAGVSPKWRRVESWPIAWIGGKPPVSTLFGVDISQSDIFLIAAWRCISCGLLEFVATEEVD